MAFKEAFVAGMDVTAAKMSKSELKEKTGIKWTRLSNMVNKVTDNPQLDAVAAMIDNFDKETFLEFVRNIRPDLPLGIIDMEGKRDVKVYDISELNKAFNKDGLEKLADPSQFKTATHSLKQLFSVRVPVEFFPSDVGVRVAGHGLEPTIPQGSAVGLSYLKSWADFVAGEIYLCNLPFEGLVLRQVVVAQAQNGLEFRALHKDKETFRSQIHHPEKAKKMIIARKTWTATRG